MPKRLIICLDGTWNSTAKEVKREDGTTVLKPTNPLKLARAVLPEDSQGNLQLTYYDTGVGALGSYTGTSNWLLSKIDKILGGAFGAGFEANVEQAATFLSNNYTPGCEVHVYGFSRGAAQARALTNFLDWMGGIPAKSDAYYIPLFFRLYLDSQGRGHPTRIVSSEGDVPIERVVPVEVTYLGLWDTVLALGSRLFAPMNQGLADRFFHVGTTPAACVRHVRQALALDEERFDYRAEVFTGPNPKRVGAQTLQQRWFCGAHGNVGGSFFSDGLANRALEWVLEEATALGLEVNQGFLNHYGASCRGPIHDSKTLLYKVVDWLRFTTNVGRRMDVKYPATANLSVDGSVMGRLCSDHTRYTGMNGPYRPAEIVAIARGYKGKLAEFYRDFDLDPTDFTYPPDL